MVKGTILSGGDDGLYTVSVIQAEWDSAAEIAALTAKISEYETKILTATGKDKAALYARKSSCEARLNFLDKYTPENEEISAWCADLTENLTGDVGLIEVPGESTEFNIQPGYTEEAAYDPDRDGQLYPTVLMNPAQAYYNLAMLPGWQKWKPTYRYGVISNIVGDVADVAFDSAASTQQGLNINQEAVLTDVPIEYMNCDGKAFEEGDEVLVQFVGQDFTSPKVIGFKQEPKECPSKYIVITHGDYVTIFSYWIEEQEITEARLKYPDTGDSVVFPVLSSQISFFYDDLEEIGDAAMFFKEYQSAKDTNSYGPIYGLLDCPLYSWIIDSFGGTAIEIGRAHV